MPESVFFERVKSEDPHDEHPYNFGRYIHKDSRSLDYPVLTSEAKCKWWPFYKARPKLVGPRDWRPTIPALDQGQLGSCTGNAAAHALATPAENHTPFDVDEAQAVAIYSMATHIDTFQGAYPPEDTGSSGLAIVKALKKLGYVGHYRHATTLRQVKVAVQTTPLLVGLSWRRAMYEPDAHGWVNYQGPVVGGHEVLLTGWEPAVGIRHGYFTFRNSWGPDWGFAGDFYLDEYDMERVLRDHGDVIQPIWSA